MDSSRITFSLNEVVSVLNSSADRLLRENFKITYSQFLFLINIQSLNNPTPSQLAGCLQVSRAAVSQRLEWFEAHDLIRVSKVADNDKNLSLQLTRKGALLATKTADFLEQKFRNLFTEINSIDLEKLDSTLKQIKIRLQQGEESQIAN